MARGTRKESMQNQGLLFLQILKRIPRTRFVSAREIQASLALEGIEVETLTMQRHLKAMREDPSLGIEVNDRGKPFGYRQTGDSPFMLAELTPQECLLLALVERNLASQLPASLVAKLDPLFTTAREILGKNGADRNSRWLEKVCMAPAALEFSKPLVKPRIFAAVSDALYRSLKVRLAYRKLGQDRAESRVASPLGIVQQDNRLYLVVRTAEAAIRNLALHRIVRAEVLEEPAEIPQGFSLQSYVHGQPFNFTGDRIEKIVLTIEITNPKTRLMLEEAPFNRTQTIEALPDGAWRVRAEMVDSLLLDSWLNTWKEQAGIRFVEKKRIGGQDRTTGGAP